MKIKTLLCSFLLLLSAGGTVNAETEQSVVVNGIVIDRFVNNLTFSGDNVTLYFEDNTSQTEDMSLVSISLDYDSTACIYVDHVKENSEKFKVYNLNGQYMGDNMKKLNKGVYIINGKKTVIK